MPASRRITRALRAAALLLALAVLAPAAAGAQTPSWQRYGGPVPGAEDLAVIAGTPYVAWSAEDGVHVARLTSATGTWQAVGGAIRHAQGAAVADAAVAGDADGHPWVTWVEEDSSGATQVRVARFDGATWTEVVGGARPVNRERTSASDPHLAFLDGRAYVEWSESNPAESVTAVARLSADGSSWEDLGFPSQASTGARIAVAGGRLYVAIDFRFQPADILYRLSAAGDSWEQVPQPGSGDDFVEYPAIADVGGALGALFTERALDADAPLEIHAGVLGAGDAWQTLDGDFAPAGSTLESLAADGSVPYAAVLPPTGGDAHGLAVSRFSGGAWEGLPSPADGGADVQFAKLAPGGLGGGMWVLFTQRAADGTVTSYVAGLDVTVPGLPPGPPDPPDPPNPPAGECANEIVGTGASELLNGTSRSDSIFGNGGRDRIFGLGAGDCLFGGHGGDRISGGRGADFLQGGAGADRLSGNSGRDDINGNSGRDRIFGGSGRDEIAAGSGNDRIDVHRGGADLVNCGSGRDTVILSRNDYLRSCERVILRR